MNIYIDYMWNNFFMEVKSNFKYKNTNLPSNFSFT